MTHDTYIKDDTRIDLAVSHLDPTIVASTEFGMVDGRWTQKRDATYFPATDEVSAKERLCRMGGDLERDGYILAVKLGVLHNDTPRTFRRLVELLTEDAETSATAWKEREVLTSITVTRDLDLCPPEVGTQCNRSDCIKVAEHRVRVEGPVLPGGHWDYYFCVVHKDTPVA